MGNRYGDIVRKMNQKKRIPVLKGVIRDNQIFVWCPFCRKYHQHGWLGKPEHRVAHCDMDSPLSETGYLVVPFTKKELKQMASALDRGGVLESCR